jgi:hypothetical protein
MCVSRVRPSTEQAWEQAEVAQNGPLRDAPSRRQEGGCKPSRCSNGVRRSSVGMMRLSQSTVAEPAAQGSLGVTCVGHSGNGA